MENILGLDNTTSSAYALPTDTINAIMNLLRIFFKKVKTVMLFKHIVQFHFRSKRIVFISFPFQFKKLEIIFFIYMNLTSISLLQLIPNKIVRLV